MGRVLSRYSEWRRAGRSGIESQWGRNFPPVQTGSGAHAASCKMGTGSFPRVKCGRGVLLTTHPLLLPRSWKSRAIPLPTLWACNGINLPFTFFFIHAWILQYRTSKLLSNVSKVLSQYRTFISSLFSVQSTSFSTLKTILRTARILVFSEVLFPRVYCSKLLCRDIDFLVCCDCWRQYKSNLKIS